MTERQHVVTRQGQIAAQRAQRSQLQTAGGHLAKGMAYAGQVNRRQFMVQHRQCEYEQRQAENGCQKKSALIERVPEIRKSVFQGISSPMSQEK
jgi:hypothetical protein